MRPAPFVYEAPAGLDEALELLARHGDEARVLAGGQSLLAMMNLRLATPAILVDLGRIDGLDGVRPTGDGLRIGAMTTQARVERDEGVATSVPLLSEAVGHIGHRQIRTRGTIGGNLAHADPASELPAVMLALEATLVAESASGERRIPAAEFFVGAYSTALAPGEVLTAIDVPALAPGRSTAIHEEVRAAGAFALAGAVAVIDHADGVCTSARVVLFGAGGAPELVSAAAELVGREIDARTVGNLVDAVEATAPDHEDVHASAEARRRLLAVSVERALWGTGVVRGDRRAA